MLTEDSRYCRWCGITMRWWRVLLMRNFCRVCRYPFGEDNPFHGRVGMRER